MHLGIQRKGCMRRRRHKGCGAEMGAKALPAGCNGLLQARSVVCSRLQPCLRSKKSCLDERQLRNADLRCSVSAAAAPSARAGLLLSATTDFYFHCNSRDWATCHSDKAVIYDVESIKGRS